MFSPATRKSSIVRQKDRNQWGHGASAPPVSSPSTPFPSELADGPFLTPSISNRPVTGTPAPWATRPSVAVRIPSLKNVEKGTNLDQTKPVYVGDFPRHLRDAQEELLHEVASGDKLFTGGMDKGTGLCWIICGNKLYIWSYLSAFLSNKCVILEIPSSVVEIRDGNKKARHSNHWLVCIVRWDVVSAKIEKVLGQCNSAGVIICNMKTQALVYWPDIFLESRNMPVFGLPTPLEVSEINFHEGRKDASGHQEICLVGSVDLSEHDHINSIIAAPISGSSKECIAIACQSSGKLCHFHFTPSGIYRKKIPHDIFGASYASHSQTNKRYARSLIWHFQPHAWSEKPGWQFFLLTDCEVQYWNVMLTPEVNVIKLWANEIVGNDGDLGIKKDLAGQKHIWLLDMQVDERGKEISILVATFCKDRLGGSSYTQYSLLTMICKAGKNININNPGAMSARVLEKKAPLQVIIPKARVEDEEFLFSMRLRVGGKPSGSAIILSGDGTATVTNYLRGCIRLYQFDLPYDAGKVLDASVFPSIEDDEEGAWVVLTEKVGVWAIPEKAVLLGGVEPPERSLSRKGSCNEGITQEEKRIQAFGGNMAPRRASSEAWSSGDISRSAIIGIVQRTTQDEEAEVLLGRLFCDFMISSEVEGAFEKLNLKGAFDKEGETNVFARMSKSIVDTLAKHWTTTRGVELVASAIVSSLLLDKQQKHQKYLHFLALSKCHDELFFKQRHTLLTIMEHGEKLSSIIQLRELQNIISQNRSNNADTPSSHLDSRLGGSLWDLIQLVGDKARRNTVMLMDRDNAEVFYSKVSDIEEFFYCLSHHITYIIGEDQSYNIQMQRAYEVSNACTILIKAAMQYRIENQIWYPSPEGLIPWNCQPVVRSGLWCVASSIMKLLKESTLIDISGKPDLWSQLEVLTDILLEAYAGSITIRIERGEEHRGLVLEYSRRRDELLDSLLELTKRFADTNYQVRCKGVEDAEAKENIFRDVSLPLLAIAKRHEGYPTLWHICYHLDDSVLLRTLMHDSRGPKGGFSNFVFEQLIKNHQFAKLLRLGEEFRDELASFLKFRNDLLWLHEIYLSQFSSASETLHTLALSQDDSSDLIDEREFVHIKIPSSIAGRRRLLNLSKIAVAAGKKEGFELKMLRVEADLRILMLQEEVLGCYSENEEKPDTNKLISPVVLIEMCLKGGTQKLALLAFEIFVWLGSSFRNSNRSLLEESWRNAADQDDWVALANAPRAKGWSDELVLENLRETILYKASYKCYGPEAETYEGGLNEVLPLRKDEADFTSPKELGSSVETILMQHKNFPDAGKLMLIAIVMGKEGINNIVETDGELAMES